MAMFLKVLAAGPSWLKQQVLRGDHSADACGPAAAKEEHYAVVPKEKVYSANLSLTLSRRLVLC